MKRRPALAFLLASSHFTQATVAWAAACCAGQAAFPTLLTGYESRRFGASITESLVIGDAPSAGLPVFRRPADRTQTRLLQINASSLLTQRWQIGASLPVSLSAHLPGDATLISAWEIVPNADDEPLKPRIYAFTQIDLPTGRSIYESSVESSRTVGDSVTGAGFFRARLGIAALTTYRKWDAQAYARASYGLSRSFSGEVNTLVAPGWAGDLALGLGYSPNALWRFGMMMQSAFNEAKQIETADSREMTGETLVWPVQIQASWFHDSNTSITLSYADETLIGPVRNTTLSRSATVSLGYRL